MENSKASSFNFAFHRPLPLLYALWVCETDLGMKNDLNALGRACSGEYVVGWCKDYVAIFFKNVEAPEVCIPVNSAYDSNIEGAGSGSSPTNTSCRIPYMGSMRNQQVTTLLVGNTNESGTQAVGGCFLFGKISKAVLR